MKLDIRVAIDGVPKRLTVDTHDIVTAVKEQMKTLETMCTTTSVMTKCIIIHTLKRQMLWVK